jgi:hypothetical protein
MKNTSQTMVSPYMLAAVWYYQGRILGHAVESTDVGVQCFEG